MLYLGEDLPAEIYIGGQKVSEMYLGNDRVFPNGANVVYHVDTSDVRTVYTDYGVDTVAALKPAKDGWEFVGWRQDDKADASVLPSLTVGTEEVNLYAVFKQGVTLTYYNGNNSPASAAGQKYYNNGNILNPKFSINPAALSGYTFLGWAVSPDAAAAVSYASIKDTEFPANTTVYARHQASVTLTYYATNATPQTQGGIIDRNNNNYSYPVFTIANPGISGWTFLGWRTDTAAAAEVAYKTIQGTQFNANATVAAVYSQTITLSYNPNGGSGTVAPQNGTRYFNVRGTYANPSFKLANNAYSRTGYNFSQWAQGSVSGAKYSPGTAVMLEANTVFFALWAEITYVITYVWNGNRTNVTVGYGKDVLHPSSFTPTKPGTSFLGWSNSASSTAVLGSLTATGAMTLYAVFKVPDANIALQNSGYYVVQETHGIDKVLVAIDTSLYPTHNVTAQVYNDWDFANPSTGICVSIVVLDGQQVRARKSPYADGPQEEHPGYVGTNKETFTLTNKPGNVVANFTSTLASSYIIGDVCFFISNVTGIGKTTVG